MFRVGDNVEVHICTVNMNITTRATKIDVPKILTVMCYIRAYSKNIG